MAATTHNITVEQGAPFKLDFVVKNPDNSNKDLTGFTARMQFRTSYSSSTTELDATTVNQKLVINVSQSYCSIDLTATDTASLIYKSYVYDIELVDSLGVPLRLVQGTVTVNPEVTR